MLTRSMKKDLGELLVDDGLITERQLKKALEQTKKTSDSLQKVLVQMGFVTEKDITEVIGKQMGVAFVDLDGRDVVRHPLVRRIVDAFEAAGDAGRG